MLDSKHRSNNGPYCPVIPFIRYFLLQFTYLGLALVLIASGLGVPLPEDIPLAFSGYLCNREYSPIADPVDANHDGIPDKPRHVPHVTLMIIAGLVGVLGGDTIVYMIGRHGLDSNTFVAKHIRKVLHSKRREQLERHFARHGNLTVLVARFLPGIRSLAFAMAGISRMSYARFLLLDGLAALVSVPLFVLLGYHFAGEINLVLATFQYWKSVILPIATLFMLIGVLVYLIRRRRNKELTPTG